MKEIVFLHQNSEKWKKFESIVKKPAAASPDELAEMFIHMTDDLAYARTHYPGSKTELFLNSLTVRFHRAIYKTKKEDSSRLITFWKDEQPVLIYKYRIHLLVSFLIFIISIGIGIISSHHDKSFNTLILSEGYVKKTMENIASGDPMAVYKSMNSINMFLGITVNNILVAFRAFAMGLLVSFGTGFMLFYNGVMLGVFHYLFYEHHLLGQSLLTVWLHGTLEISAIIIAGGAGLVMGNSILFPGTYSRLTSFRRGAGDGVRIVMGTVPIFIMAGFIEGFITRYSDMPLWLNLFIIGLSALYITWFYIIYPVVYHRKRTDFQQDV